MLSKNYKIKVPLFREAYKAYQKKFVYPKNYIFTAIFIALAANFFYGAFYAPDNYLAYILAVICLALAFRELFIPGKTRNSTVEAFAQLDDPVYHIEITENSVSFSSVYQTEAENDVTAENDIENDVDEAAEPTVLPLDDKLSILEYEAFFLVVYGKTIFFIVPKEEFSDDELQVVRNLNHREVK